MPVLSVSIKIDSIAHIFWCNSLETFSNLAVNWVWYNSLLSFKVTDTNENWMEAQNTRCKLTLCNVASVSLNYSTACSMWQQLILKGINWNVIVWAHTVRSVNFKLSALRTEHLHTFNLIQNPRCTLTFTKLACYASSLKH